DVSNSEGITLNITLVDNAGNTTNVVKELNNVIVDVTRDVADIVIAKDNEIKANPTKVTNINVNDMGLAPIVKREYTLDGENYVEFNADGNVNIEFKDVARNVLRVRTTDASNNVYVSEDVVVEVDTRLPEFTITVKDGGNTLTNYSLNKNVLVHVNTVDSDVDKYCVALSECEANVEWNSYSAVEVSLVEGKNIVYVSLVDNAGNETVKEVEITYIIPVLTNNNNEEGKYYKDYNITISGLNDEFAMKIRYGLLKQANSIYDEAYNMTRSIVNNDVVSGEVTYNGTYKFIARVYVSDKVNYFKEYVVENINFDSVIEIDNSTLTYIDVWTNEDVRVTVDVLDEVSGIKETKLMKRNSDNDFEEVKACITNELTVECMVSEIGVYRIRVIDNADNIKDSNQFTISKIDRSGYEIDVIYDDKVSYLKIHNIMMEFEGSHAPIVKILYLLTNKELEMNEETFVENYNSSLMDSEVRYGSKDNNAYAMSAKFEGLTGIYKLYVYTIDAAGNIVIENTDNVLYFDNTAPVVSFDEFSDEYDAYNEEEIKALVNIVDNDVGTLGYIYYALVDDNGEYTLDRLSELEGEYKIKVIAKDSLGNTSEEFISENVVLIDNVGPRVERTNADSPNVFPIFELKDVSDVASVKYCYNSESFDNLTVCETEAIFTSDVDEDGDYEFEIEGITAQTTIYLRIVTVDELGNENVIDTLIEYDNIVPSIKVDACIGNNTCLEEDKEEFTQDGNVLATTTLTNKDLYVGIDVEDTISGVKCSYVIITNEDVTGSMSKEACSINNDGYEKIGGKYRIDGNKYINIFSIDNAGNETTVILKVNTINKVGIEFAADYVDKDGYYVSNQLVVNTGNIVRDNIASINYKHIEFFSNHTKYINSELYSNRFEGNIISLAKDFDEDNSMKIDVVENGIYVIAIEDVWGNVTYQRVVITNIDKEIPEFNEEKLFAIFGNNLFEKISGVYTKSASASITGVQEFIYNGKLEIKVPANAVKDNIHIGVNESVVRVKVCYGEENNDNCTYYNIALRVNNNMMNNVSETAITLRSGYTGDITYKLVDEAGNESGKSYTIYVMNLESHNIVMNIEFVDANTDDVLSDEDINNYYYNNMNASISVSSDEHNTFAKMNMYLMKDEVKYCAQEVSTAGTYSLTSCLGTPLSGEYELYYEITDILGNESEAQLVKNLKLDTTSPVNKADVATFKLKKIGENYSLLSVLNAEFDNTSKLVVYYGNTDDVYCELTVDSQECGNIDLSKYTEGATTFNFTTKIVDRAGNVSGRESYEYTYNGFRSFDLAENYVIEYDGNKEIIGRKVVLTITVDMPTGKVTKVEVYNNGTLMASLANGTVITKVNNSQYTLTITPTNFATLFGETYTGVIDKELMVKVYDEDLTEIEGKEVGAIDAAEGKDTIELVHNLNNPEFVFDANNKLEITTVNTTNKYSFTSNKEIINVKYIFERQVNVETIYVAKFESVYNSCSNSNKCVSGLVNAEGNNTYSFTVGNHSLLENGKYKVTIYAEDKDGHKVVHKFANEISLDNTAPIVTIDKTQLSIEDPTYKIYSQPITIKFSDKSEYINYNSLLSSINIFNNLTGENVHSISSINSNEKSLLIGGTNTIRDGHYRIEVVDNMGHKTVEYVIVDTVNDGFNYTNDMTKYNKDYLEDLGIVLLEDMRVLEVEFYTTSNLNIRITVDKDGNYTICTSNQGRLVCEETISTEISIKMDESISIKELLEVHTYADGTPKHTIEGLNNKISVLRVIGTNVSGLKVSKDKDLDFENPVINVKEGAQYTANRERITRFEANKEINGYNCNSVYCYTLNIDVLVNKETDELANVLMNIVSLFISRVDGKSYNDARISERLFITYGDGTKFNTNEENWESYSILDVIGEYTLRFDYKDEAGNDAQPVFLILNVKDLVRPTITLNNTSLKDVSTLEIKTNGGAVYVDEGIIGKDNYGFNVDGELVKETASYNMYYTLDGVSVNFENVEGRYLLRVGEIVFAEKVENEYVFYKKGAYTFTYEVVDVAGNNLQKTLTINVIDKNAPNIDEDNTINIDGVKFVIDEVQYTLIEDEFGSRLVDVDGNEIVVLDNMFELNNKKYMLDKVNAKVIRVLNINNGKVCFVAGENCEVDMNQFTAYDNEDGEEKAVKLSKIEYSMDGNKYTLTNEYEIVLKAEEMFEVENIEFKLTGYYKIVFYSEDSKGNRREVEYI
ncbi:MAG: hypothetical protein IJA65_03475, partial [Acholeplasmatales bacterium]|nr:hypothetical protein [Acholeplasmatales bacterium]